ncbi:MAG: FG-GAP-like repeat-containing protein [Ignavibacteriaceae bacterium]
MEFSSIDWADYNNDGKLDFILTGNATDSSKGVTKIYRNDGDDVFTEVKSNLTGVENGSVSWGDLDNDGDQDTLLCGMYLIKIYENNDGNFDEIINIQKGKYNKGAWGDFNNDGLLDFCVISADTNNVQNNGYIKVFRNNGDKTFSELTTSYLVPYLYSSSWDSNLPHIYCRDYDTDGDLDIILPAENNIIKNDGDFKFQGIPIPSSFSFADYDNDGDLDVMGNSGLLRNNIIFNENFNTKKKLNPPVILSAEILSEHSVKFSWNIPELHDTSKVFSYNLRIGTIVQGVDILSPMSNVITGKRLKPAIGNAGFDTSWTINNLPEGTYYWSVQSVDNNFDASVFADEQKIKIDYSKFEIPTQFLLYQNYPNPFNSRTTIRYDIPVDQFVTIKVYDITGSELKTLVNKNQKAGRYMVNFDGGSFASGIYFCRIITEKFKKVLKMILLK